MKGTVPLKIVEGIVVEKYYHNLLFRHAILNGLRVLGKGTENV